MPKKTDKKIDIFEGEKEYRNPNPLLWQHPFRAVVSGASGTGKTGWLIKQLIRKDSPFDRVIWCAPDYSLNQPKLKKLKEILKSKLIFIDGLDEERINELVNEGDKKGLQQAVILDDLMYEENDFTDDLFTSGRHKNISTIELTQRLFTKKGRTSRLNCNYFVVFPFGDLLEMTMLARQLSPLHFKKIIEAYKYATEKSFGCLIIDKIYYKLKQIKDNKLLNYRDTEWDDVFKNMVDV
jgi:hypothetical protein